jgi:Ni2+-binding GTPase involved in maturation of urease and hydrogenase
VKVHLVSGFLGSGKTTAIANAAKFLNGNQTVTGVVTNDQGKYLVDSRFMRFEGIASAEVAGSCFCCNFTEFEHQIRNLHNSAQPTVIFAESVGSCTDLISTVVKPLLRFHAGTVEAVTLSGFADARLLLQYLEGTSLPFTADTNYIWEKQIEETEILVVNKVDLLRPDELTRLGGLVKRAYPGKVTLFQNSLDMESIRGWLAVLASYQAPQAWRSIEVDYRKYGKGEADLAWLDEELTFTGPVADTVDHTARFIEKFAGSILRQGHPVGHLKFFISNGSQFHKLSYTTVVGQAPRVVLPLENSRHVTVGINARIQTTPEVLRRLLGETVEEFQKEGLVGIEEENASSFSPGFPNPTYRFVDQPEA